MTPPIDSIDTEKMTRVELEKNIRSLYMRHLKCLKDLDKARECLALSEKTINRRLTKLLDDDNIEEEFKIDIKRWQESIGGWRYDQFNSDREGESDNVMS